MGRVFSVTPLRLLAPAKGPPVLIVHDAGWAPVPFWKQRLEAKPFRLCPGSPCRPVRSRHYADLAVDISTIFYCTKPHFLMCFLHKTKQQNMNFNFQQPSTFVFMVLHRNVLIKSYSSFAVLSAYKIPRYHVDCCKFCIHVKTLNVCHFGIGTTRLQIMAW
jgi:hypothetical protein